MRFGAGLLLFLAAAAARAEVPEAHAAARRALVADLHGLAGWCTQSQIYGCRNDAYEILIRFHPDHREARKWLGYVRRNGRWVREGSVPYPRNLNAKAHAEYATRRDEIVNRFAEAVVAAVEAEGDRWSREARREALKDVLDLAPNHAAARALNGQVRDGDRWVREETARSARRRKEIARAARAALAQVPEPRATAIDPAEAALGVPWTGAVETANWRVLTSASRSELQQAARIAEATVPFFEECFRGAVGVRPRQAFLLVSTYEEYESVIRRHPGASEGFRKFALGVGSVWLPKSNRVVARKDTAEGRAEIAARQPLGSLLYRQFGIEPEHGWACEGFGVYLTEALVGLRTSYSVWRGEYARDNRREKELLWGRIRAPQADWFEIARELLGDGKGPDFALLMSKDVNTLEPADIVFSYVIAAYLLEAHVESTPELLRAVGERRIPFNDALRDKLGMTPSVLGERVAAWLEER